MSNGHQQPQRATTPSSDININNNNNYTTTTTHPPTTITQEYRPCSPDLSAYGIPSHSQQHQQQQSLSHRNYQDQHSPSTNHSRPASFQLRQGSSTALTGLPGDAGSSSIGGYPPAQPTHRGSYDASPYFCPQAGFSQGGYFTGPILQRRETSGYGSLSARTASDLGEHRSRVPSSGGGGLTYSPTAISSAEAFPSNQQESRNQNQLGFAPNSVSDSGTPAQTPTFPPISSSISKQQQQQLDMPPSRRKRGQTDDKTNNGDVDPTPEPSTTTDKAPGAKNSRKRKSDSGHQAWTVGRAPGDVGPSLGIDIKTKFPVARIKRIMQADEDVGKVAQATPTAVSKALELFMITMVTKAATEARDRSSKRVTAAHLKQAIIKDQTFDFLQEIIEKVADPTEKKGGRGGSEDVDDGAGGGAGPAKRKRAPRTRKKADSDED